MKPLHLSVGRINIDIIAKINKIPDIDEFETTDTLEILPGGAAVNYAVAINKFGHSIKILSKIGKDSLVSYVLERIAEMGVGLDYVEETNLPQSMALIFLRDNGSISMVRKLGSSILLDKEDIKKVFGLFDVIHFASISPDIVVRDPYAKLITYDPGPNSSKIPENFGNADIIYLNERESTKVKIESLKARLIVIKMGSKGAKVISENEECYCEPYKVQTVLDTTGAGDVFDAAFNYAYVQGYSIEDTLRFAVTASALKVMRIGGINSPTREEVMNALNAYTPNTKCK
ncbi:carbohydrate kinase family protein [Sulfolobus acidocaldarius]|uniref:Carbohydrate kinase n=5 Tax=Sulfolobaceae TaxID=118883 RepID=Q4JB81_SULAC|nr:carbohydrate kinase family protein [Sulfolobus acidocaldarius]AAB38089.1 ribokinase [Saccharolobus solfataricus]AAY79948.1 carbohydrate kinase [Sulfolobus acidocaldarius DSM 639]AGE70518.1 carbohydrate kinase [Sulfolobus acidocaldarius N8]AGE72791.1 carbohydrate kinase [Sulfolobus acidocaldarius Ron12/I]ALU29118.1 sugar kinase [Sulfolobus acidocaldarius]